jgi:hypothetical protein
MTYFNAQGQGRVGWRSLVFTQVVNAVDADAQAFISAAGITNLTQASAVNTLVNDLKAYGLWTKMKALYPMVGGTATTHKWNLKDPRDLDAAFRLVFSGGWVHSSTGAKPNGTTGYADTKLILSSSTINVNSLSMAVYLRTNFNNTGGTSDMVDMGAENASFTNRNFIEPANGNNAFAIVNSSGVNFISTANTTSNAMFIANRTSSTVVNLFKNNTKLIADTNKALASLTTIPIYLGAHNLSSVPSAFSLREQAFASIGDGLTDAEAANFYTAVQKYQTTLGRQV